MRPTFQLLDSTLIERIMDEAFDLIDNPGVRVAPYVVELLQNAGIAIQDGIAHIPQAIARHALASVPREFFLYDRNGKTAVRYGGNDVHFDPGSSCLNILDPNTSAGSPGAVRRSGSSGPGRRNASAICRSIDRHGL